MESLLHPDYNSPSSLKSFLEENHMAMQKKFGQNFLINQAARASLIDMLDINDGTAVWEIGPGLGSMTDEILNRKSNVTAFEIDHGFAHYLPLFFSDYVVKGSFKIVEGDVLKTWKKEYNENSKPQRLFGNLPYNIAATIIADTISSEIRFEKAVVTVQKEVGQRMTAKPGSSDYSSFSVLCQWAYTVKPIMDLAGGNFWPRPNVDSRAVLMTKKEIFPLCQNPALFMKMIRALFSSRRKTVRNNLLQLTNSVNTTMETLSQAHINEKARAEDLTVEELITLSDALNSFIVN